MYQSLSEGVHEYWEDFFQKTPLLLTEKQHHLHKDFC